MKTRIYPEHVVSAYILYKVGRGEKQIDSDEVSSVIPRLNENPEFELMRISYRSTAIGKYSPEFRSYFRFLDDINYAWERSETSAIISPEGIEHAVEVMTDFRKEKGESAANRLQEALGQTLKAA